MMLNITLIFGFERDVLVFSINHNGVSLVPPAESRSASALVDVIVRADTNQAFFVFVLGFYFTHEIEF